jgi:hypothetical protein
MLLQSFYEKHPRARKIVLIAYEVSIGIMLYLALHYANQAYDLGASDCNDWIKNMSNIYDTMNFTDYSNISFTGTLVQPEAFTH